MLKKLFKYDFIYIQRGVVVYYFLMIILALLYRVTSGFQGVIIEIISAIFGGASISMMFSALITCVLRSWSRFRLNFYKDESYLTHSLPVTKGKLYFSKILAEIACHFTCFVSIIVSLFIGYYTEERLYALKDFLLKAKTSLNINIYLVLCGVLLLLFLELLFVFLIGNLATVIGQRANDGKIVKSIIIGIALYFASQIVNLLAVAVIGVFDDELNGIIKKSQVPPNVLLKLLWIFAVIYIVYCILILLWGKSAFNKGVNVE